MRPLDPALEGVIVTHLRSWYRELWKLALLCYGFAGILVAVRVFGGPPRMIPWALVFVAIGGWLHWLARRDPLEHAVFRTLRERPQDIVWAYVWVQRQRGSSKVRSSVMLGLTDGRKLDVGATIGNENELFDALARVLPWATLGYTPELEAAFRKAPASLRRG